MAQITLRELNRATLDRQGLLEPMTARTAGEAVQRLGSLQAQHPEWPPIALAARAADPRTADLATALDRREVVRSSLMRITIHVVSGDDLWPMFAICQPLRLTQWRLLAKADPIDSPLGRRMTAAHEVALAALSSGNPTSTELDRLMAREAGPVDAPVQRMYWRHLSAVVPLVHVPHAGEGYGRSRYAVASQWLGIDQPEIELAEARTRVARRYLAAFGPASIDDLAAYVGRGKGGIAMWRDAVAAIGDELVSMTDDLGRTLHDLESAPRPHRETPAPPRLLARWDSLLLSHAPKHRDRVIDDDHRAAVYSKNADVLPTFLIDGRVAGTWTLSRPSGGTAIVLRPFATLAVKERDALETETYRIMVLLDPGASDRRVTFAA
ncbi:MAG: winged helix DNA-binding domain-containing protein [Chloroflexi bacterium]|nr:winged helix DNA-binding domain-containing protein [Chloroflexota bacterium]